MCIHVITFKKIILLTLRSVYQYQGKIDFINDEFIIRWMPSFVDFLVTGLPLVQSCMASVTHFFKFLLLLSVTTLKNKFKKMNHWGQGWTRSTMNFKVQQIFFLYKDACRFWRTWQRNQISSKMLVFLNLVSTKINRLKTV